MPETPITTARAKMIEAMERFGRFTLPQLCADTGASYANANRLVWQLLRAGMVHCEVEKRNGYTDARAVYRLDMKPPHENRTTARERMWSAMRILKQFTIPELAATPEPKHNNALRFVLSLARSDYLRIVRPRVSGVKAGAAIYLLVNDSGPGVPRVNAA